MIIALTGGIGSGKSLATEILREMGFKVIDTDLIAHELSQPNKAVYQAIFETFGKEYFTKTHELDRRKLGDLIFNDAPKRKLLDSAVHPIILNNAKDQYNDILKNSPNAIVFITVPLLFEGSDNIKNMLPYDKSLLITADDDIRIKRMMDYRKMTKSEATARLLSQMPESEKAQLADYVITNNAAKKDLQKKIAEFIKTLK